MLNAKDGEKLTKYARKVIEAYVKSDNLSFILNDIYNEKLGVFVTIHKYPSNVLRGCIGIPYPIMSLKDAITEAAQSATKDPRFNNLIEEELNEIIIEITILTKPELMNVNNPKEYLDLIRIGRDGLIIKKDYFSGLLLPQVPVEQHWNKEEFLSNICIKANLPSDAWLDKKTQIFKFQGQIFFEKTPNGEIQEKI